MKNFVSKLKKINTVILSILLLFALGYIVTEVVKSARRSSRYNQNRNIEVIIPDEDGKTDEVVEYTIENPQHIKDVIIYQVTADKVLLGSTALDISSGSYSKIKGGSYGRTVNLLFYSQTKKTDFLLLKNDALIISHTYASRDDDIDFGITKNIYEIVTEDTNSDNKLNSEDRRDLYISNYDGSKLLKIGDNINGYNIVSRNTVVFNSRENNKNIYKIVNVSTMKVEDMFDVDEIF